MMVSSRIALLFSAVLVAIPLSGCSSSDDGGTTPPADTGSTGTDTGSTDTGSKDTGAADTAMPPMDMGADTGPAADTGSAADTGAATDTGSGTKKTVKITGLSFDPPSIEVKVGDTVEWTGVSGHTVTSGAGCTSDGTFDGTADPFTFTFTKAGTFPYFCRPHCSSGMKGTVVVK